MGDCSQQSARVHFSGLITILVWFYSAVVFAATIYVDVDAGRANDGFSWENAYTDLQSALGAAQDGDEIWVAEGTYKPSSQVGGTGERYSTFQMKNGVGIYGGFSGQETTIGERNWTVHQTILSGAIGAGVYHVFYHPDGIYLNSSAVLDGFTITSGNGDEDGTAGGMYNHNSSPTIRNCLFRNNSGIMRIGPYGIGYYGTGGAIYNYRSSPALINCIFYNNGSGDGGGIFNSDSSPTIVNCVFTSNTARIWPGTGSIITGAGGAIFNTNSSSPTIINCTITKNSAGMGLLGGGIHNVTSSSPFVTNSVIWDNGQEIYNQEPGSVPTLSYCNVQGGVNGDSSRGYESIDGGGNINVYPIFADGGDPAGPDGVFGTNDDGLIITSRSPCMDVGDNSANSEAKDLAGNARIQNTMIDLGAYEKAPSIPRYRLYNPNDGNHHYTTSRHEYDVLDSIGWVQEGTNCYVDSAVSMIDSQESIPYYRLYNPNSFEHHWTTDANEYNVLGTIGWIQEGVDGYVFAYPVTSCEPLYRLYNPNDGLHHWTMDSHEKKVLIGFGFIDEGIAYYVFP